MYFNNDNNLNEITVISYICYNDDGIINSNNMIYIYIIVVSRLLD